MVYCIKHSVHVLVHVCRPCYKVIFLVCRTILPELRWRLFLHLPGDRAAAPRPAGPRADQPSQSVGREACGGQGVKATVSWYRGDNPCEECRSASEGWGYSRFILDTLSAWVYQRLPNIFIGTRLTFLYIPCSYLVTWQRIGTVSGLMKGCSEFDIWNFWTAVSCLAWSHLSSIIVAPGNTISLKT